MPVNRSLVAPIDRKFFRQFDHFEPNPNRPINLVTAAETDEERALKRKRFPAVIDAMMKLTSTTGDMSRDWDHIWGKDVVNRMERASMLYLFTGDKRCITWATEALDAMKKCPRKHFTYSTCLGVMDLDLRTAAVVSGCSFMKGAMGHVLDKKTLDVMDEVVIERCLLPGLAEMNKRKIPWMKSKANWRIILPGMFAVGAMMWHDKVKPWREIVEFGLEGVLVALNTGDRAGGWNEGPGYWEYGLSHAGLFAWALRNFTEGKVDLFSQQFLSHTGDFRLSMHTKPNEVWNWSDGGKQHGESALLALLAREYQNTDYQWLLFREGVKHIYQLYYMDGALPATQPSGRPRTIHFPGCGVVVARTGYMEKDTFIGAKAGDIPDWNHHCHMDSGTLVIHAAGRELLARPEHWGYPREAPKDPKAPRPSRPGLFDEELKRYKRWDLDTVSAVGHNVPVIEGQFPQPVLHQPPKIKLLASDDKHDVIAIDSSVYYKPMASRVRRLITFLRPDVAIVIDDIVSSKPIRTRLQFHYLDKGVATENELHITNGPAALRVRPLWPSQEDNFIIGTTDRATYYETPAEIVRRKMQMGFIENLWRKKKLTFVTALQFGPKGAKPIDFTLEGDPIKDVNFSVLVQRGGTKQRVKFDLSKFAVKLA